MQRIENDRGIYLIKGARFEDHYIDKVSDRRFHRTTQLAGSLRNRNKVSSSIISVKDVTYSFTYQTNQDMADNGICTLALYHPESDHAKNPLLFVRYAKGRPFNLSYSVVDAQVKAANDFQKNNPQLTRGELIKHILQIQSNPNPGLTIPRLSDLKPDTYYAYPNLNFRYDQSGDMMRFYRESTFDGSEAVIQVPAFLSRATLGGVMVEDNWYKSPLMSVDLTYNEEDKA